MTQDLADKLISHYKDVVGRVEKKNNIFQIRKLLCETYTHGGICYASFKLFVVHLYGDRWVDDHKRGMFNACGYWCSPPRYCSSKAEILTSLRTRISILESFTESN